MSSWSAKIFASDIAMDIKSDFCDLYGIEKTIDEIHKYILSYCPNDNDEEACAFWTALAAVEWEYGMLDEKVKNKALDIIINHPDTNFFIKEKDRKTRQKNLNELALKLETPNEKPKKAKKPFVYRCPYSIGDVLAIKLNDKYAYIHVCGILKNKHKIEELAEDSLYIKVFDRLSNEILDIKKFKPTIFKKAQYLKLDYCEGLNCYCEQLWCTGAREKEALEKKLTFIGNIPVKPEYANGVCRYYQFKLFEDSLTKRFNGKYLSEKYKSTWN